MVSEQELSILKRYIVRERYTVAMTSAYLVSWGVGGRGSFTSFFSALSPSTQYHTHLKWCKFVNLDFKNFEC